MAGQARPVRGRRRRRPAAGPRDDRCLVHLAGEGPRACHRLPVGEPRRAGARQAAVRARPGKGGKGVGWCARPSERRSALVGAGEAAVGLGQGGSRLLLLGAAPARRATWRRSSTSAPMATAAAARARQRRDRTDGPSPWEAGMREITVFHATAGRRKTTATLTRLAQEAARAGGPRCAWDEEGDAQARVCSRLRGLQLETRRSSARSICASCSGATGRSSARCRSTRGTGVGRVRDQTSERSASWRQSRMSAIDEGIRARPERGLRVCCVLPGDRARRRGPRGTCRSRRRPRRLRSTTWPIHRKVGERVAELAYGLEGEGGWGKRALRRARGWPTPAGSTGYNLANGGPVMGPGASPAVWSRSLHLIR